MFKPRKGAHRTMTDIQKEIKEALEEIDGTPWRVGTPSPNGLQNVGTKMGVMVCQAFNTEDAHLIANAPTWLLHQQELIEQQTKEIRRLSGIEQSLIDFRNDMIRGQSEPIEDLYAWLESTTGYKGDE